MQHAVLSIAGSDPSGGAGVQADIKAISANGGYAMAAVTSLTAQNTVGVRSVHTPPASFVREQLVALSDDCRIDAVKIGMLSRRDVVEVVAEWIADQQPPHVVLDPVMVSRSGHRLLEPVAVDAIRHDLCPLVDVVTPNLPELADLLDAETAVGWPAALDQAAELAAGTGVRVLVKGGHLSGRFSPDALVEPGGPRHQLAGERIDTRHTHGTGCSLSAALATLRPARADWLSAAQDAKRWLAGAIGAAERLGVGRGNGPVHHFHRWQQPAHQPFTRQVWESTAGLRRAIDGLPFLRQLADGTLAEPAFIEYLRQDALYLQEYSRVLAGLSALAPTQDQQLLWARSAQQCLVVERSLHESWLGVPAADEPSAVCTAYTSYLRSLVASGEYATAVAGVLPCFWIYADVGERIKAAVADRAAHPYRQWIDQYGDPDFAARCEQVRRLADRLAEAGSQRARQRMAAAFTTATRYEWMFWDAPWRGEHWPV
jgi:hydroxymethylpyrimidine kinase/phosphomethylpyrimidine kinase